MVKDKESPLMQELGPRKYNKLIQDNSTQYDKFKAGKRDPKTGEYFRHIGFDKPKDSKFGQDLGFLDCPYCDNYFQVRSSTAGIICSKCKKFIALDYNKDTKEINIRRD